MKQIKIIVGVGCGLRKDGSSIDTTDRREMLARAKHFLLTHYGAYTVSGVFGGWKDETGCDWSEPGYQFSVTVSAEKLDSVPAAYIAGGIRDIFEQRCVVLETVEVNFELV